MWPRSAFMKYSEYFSLTITFWNMFYSHTPRDSRGWGAALVLFWDPPRIHNSKYPQIMTSLGSQKQIHCCQNPALKGQGLSSNITLHFRCELWRISREWVPSSGREGESSVLCMTAMLFKPFSGAWNCEGDCCSLALSSMPRVTIRLNFLLSPSFPVLSCSVSEFLLQLLLYPCCFWAEPLVAHLSSFQSIR